MTLPDDFSPAEFLQDIIKRTLNREVREWFQDLGGEDWDPDITTPRAALRLACTHLENDTLEMTLLRFFCFNWLVKRNFEEQSYGIPSTSFDSYQTYKPQLILHFQGIDLDRLQDQHPVRKRISVRLKEAGTSLTTSDLSQLQTKVRTQFATGTRYRWQAGRVLLTYKDKANGYNLKIHAQTQAEGVRVIRDVLQLQNDSYRDELLTVHESGDPGSAYPANPGLEFILGKTRERPHRRPIETVEFHRAALLVHGVGRPIVLVDAFNPFAENVEYV